MIEKEIGGYIELDKYSLPMLHEGALALNCGRNCLAYIIRAKGIKKLFLPYLICDSVIDICKKEKIEFAFYHIDKSFLPLEIPLQTDDWVYIVNFYAQLSDKDLLSLKSKYQNIIIDNAQAYFKSPIDGVDTIYTCRKFFGVPDGAFLYTDKKLDAEFEQDISYNRMSFLLGRFETNASDFYSNYVKNNASFKNEPIKRMSKLTDNLLHAIDYEKVKLLRTKNYNIYLDCLKEFNKIELRNIEGAFAYPLVLDNGAEVRKKLIENKIYVPLLWSNVSENFNKDTIEYKLSSDLLPLPVDQRYSKNDIEFVIEQIERIMRQSY